jgi:glycosyltransferase involved in cell wall biosynthesis
MTQDVPIRVCFVVPKAYPLFNSDVKSVFGGAEVDCYLLATELAKDEAYDVSCIVADYGQDSCQVRQDVTIIKSLDFKKNALNGAWRIWRAMNKANADIYLLKTASPGIPLAKVFCILHRKAFVYRTSHSYECDGTYLREHRFWGRLFAWSLRHADMIITQNVTDRDNLHDTIGVSSLYIPNGHRLQKLSGTNRDCVLWVGRSTGFKQAERFLDLAEKFPEQKFVMICQRATQDEHFDRLCHRAGIMANVEFHKRISFHEIDTYFERAKVLINTSDAEGFPNTFIQAGRSSTPILSLAVDPDGFINKNNCGINCNGNWQLFVDSLEIMTEKKLSAEMGANARKFIEDNHDITKIIEKYKEIFRKIV